MSEREWMVGDFVIFEIGGGYMETGLIHGIDGDTAKVTCKGTDIQEVLLEAIKGDVNEMLAGCEDVPQPLTNRNGTITVSRHYKIDGETIDPDDVSETIVLKPFEVSHLASVGCNISITNSLGQWESAKVGVFVSLPCYVEEMQEAFAAAKKFADEKMTGLMKEVTDLKKARNRK